METDLRVTLETNSGDSVSIAMDAEEARAASTIRINGIPHHFERIARSVLLSQYRVDDDPDYSPVADEEGWCYVMVPFSR